MNDWIAIYLFAGVAVSLEPIWRIIMLLVSNKPAARKYRANWTDIVETSNMPIVIAVILTAVIGVFQLGIRILLWPITVVHLYFKYNKD